MEQKPRTLLEAVQHYANADNSLGEVADSRWQKAVVCPHCQAGEPMFLKTRRIWKCSKCRKQFSIKAGTVFEDSPIGLDKWLPAVWLIANSKNGISSWELHRTLGVTQKTAWFMLHRIRLAMQELGGGKLSGEVEVDETFIGGKARNMHSAKRREKIKGRGTNGKSVVMGMLQRGGKVRTAVIENRDKATLQGHVEAHVKPGANVFTDELVSYWGLDEKYVHQIINHAEQYVNGNIHTNGMENFWSLLKRGLSGTYVSVEPFHLFRYIDEQAFRFNNREDADDFARFKMVLSQIVGKRLTYQALIGKEDGTSEVPF